MSMWINVALGILIVLFLVKRLMPVKGIRQISTAQLKEELQKKGAQFVDVRTPAEFRSGHVPGFQNIPLHQLAEKSGKLAKEREVVVMCQSGIRSKQAAKLLKQQGFSHITNVSGGMSAWQ